MIRSLAARLRRWFLGETLWSLGKHGELPDHWILRRDVKSLGYRLARELEPALQRVDTSGEPRRHGLPSKATTQRDLETPWFGHWCKELKIAPIFHRKLWEYAFVLQALFEHGALRAGAEGLGFGCGEEPIASYLASRGVSVTVTDLDPARARGLGWIETGQHASAVEQAFRPELVAREQFDRLVRLEYVDMNDIPGHLAGKHDFCWSICAFEHLGSIEQGLRFVEKAMETLRPGGLAVHTTEFSYLVDDRTVDRGPTVLFQKRHFLELAERLRGRGHVVGDLDFDPGDGWLDGFVDVPPYAWDGPPLAGWGRWGVDYGHLKLAVAGIPSTCFGLVVRRRSDRSG